MISCEHHWVQLSLLQWKVQPQICAESDHQARWMFCSRADVMCPVMWKRLGHNLVLAKSYNVHDRLIILDTYSKFFWQLFSWSFSSTLCPPTLSSIYFSVILDIILMKITSSRFTLHTHRIMGSFLTNGLHLGSLDAESKQAERLYLCRYFCMIICDRPWAPKI